MVSRICASHSSRFVEHRSASCIGKGTNYEQTLNTQKMAVTRLHPDLNWKSEFDGWKAAGTRGNPRRYFNGVERTPRTAPEGAGNAERSPNVGLEFQP